MTAPDTLPPELAELGELLREDPPRPDAAWARELDARAAAGFPRPPRRSPWAVLKPARRFLVPAVSFACVALLVVGLSHRATCSSDDSGGGGSGGGGGDQRRAAGGSERRRRRRGRAPRAVSRRRPTRPAAARGSDGRDRRSRSATPR